MGIGASLLIGAYFAPMAIDTLFTLGNTITMMFSTSPSPTQSVAEGIESMREQAWNNYGAYQGTSNPSTITEQAQNNGLTYQSDDDFENNKKSEPSPFVSGWFDDEGNQHSTSINPKGEIIEHIGSTNELGNLNYEKITYRENGYRSIISQTWNGMGQTERIWHYVYDQLGYLQHIDLKYTRTPLP